MKKAILLYLFLLSCIIVRGQMIQSYIINVENGKAYLDIIAPKVKVGDVLSIHEDAGYMIHPITKKKIKKEGEILADLEIIELHEEYSVATIFPEDAIKKIKPGMIAEMPELPKGYKDEPEKVIEEKKSIPTDADGIIQRYLQVTGLEKWSNNLANIPPFYIKKEISYADKKGKKENLKMYYAYDLPAKKIFIKIENPKDNLLLIFSHAFAISGNEGWVRFKKNKTIKIKEKQIIPIWNKEGNPLSLQIYNAANWDRKLGEKRIIGNKACTGIIFTSKAQHEVKSARISEISVTLYFDDATGLISYSENNLGVKQEYLAYQQFKDLLLCSESKIVYPEGKIKQETVVLQEICFDCPIDHSLFTKEGVKNAFK